MAVIKAGSSQFPFHITDIAALLRLNIRRRGPDFLYVDCPLCGDHRGKLYLKTSRDVWHCNYCQESGGMLALYAKVYGISNADAYREICEALQTGDYAPEYQSYQNQQPQEIAQSVRASRQAIHQTLSMLFSMLSLTPKHRAHLREARGLTDDQVERFGFKSTPPPYLCKSLTARLLKQGCTLDNVTVKGRLLVWGGGIKAVYCNNGTQMPEVVVARVDDAVKVIYDRDSTLAVIDTIKVRITERAKQHKETEVIFYDVSGLREAQKQLNAIVADNQIALTAPAHLYALVGEQSVKAEFVNNSKADTYKIEIRRNKDNTLIADAFELAAGKSISTLTLLEAPEFGNVDCTVTITAYRDGKQIGTLNTELTLHTAYLWPKEVQ